MMTDNISSLLVTCLGYDIILSGRELLCLRMQLLRSKVYINSASGQNLVE